MRRLCGCRQIAQLGASLETVGEDTVAKERRKPLLGGELKVREGSANIERLIRGHRERERAEAWIAARIKTGGGAIGPGVDSGGVCERRYG